MIIWIYAKPYFCFLCEVRLAATITPSSPWAMLVINQIFPTISPNFFICLPVKFIASFTGQHRCSSNTLNMHPKYLIVVTNTSFGVKTVCQTSHFFVPGFLNRNIKQISRLWKKPKSWLQTIQRQQQAGPLNLVTWPVTLWCEVAEIHLYEIAACSVQMEWLQRVILKTFCRAAHTQGRNIVRSGYIWA